MLNKIGIKGNKIKDDLQHLWIRKDTWRFYQNQNSRFDENYSFLLIENCYQQQDGTRDDLSYVTS